MLQVRKELDKLDPGTLDLIAVEHNIRSCCTVRANFACRTIRYGEDLGMNEQLIMKTREYITAVVGIVHGPKNKASSPYYGKSRHGGTLLSESLEAM
jgi:hypothetical protein